jgi:hypothetical protein
MKLTNLALQRPIIRRRHNLLTTAGRSQAALRYQSAPRGNWFGATPRRRATRLTVRSSWLPDHSNRAQTQPAPCRHCRNRSRSHRSTSVDCAHRLRRGRHAAAQHRQHGDRAAGHGPSSPGSEQLVWRNAAPASHQANRHPWFKGLLDHPNLLRSGPTTAPLNRGDGLNVIRRAGHRHGYKPHTC